MQQVFGYETFVRGMILIPGKAKARIIKEGVCSRKLPIQHIYNML